MQFDLGGVGYETSTRVKAYKHMFAAREAQASVSDSAHQIHHDSNFYEIKHNNESILTTDNNLHSIGATNILCCLNWNKRKTSHMLAAISDIQKTPPKLDHGR